MKNIFLILIFLVGTLSYAQDEYEARMTPEAEIQMSIIDSLYQQQLQDNYKKTYSDELVMIPIKAHIIRRSTGVGGLTSQELNDAIELMNSKYLIANMEFYICGDINYIDSDKYYQATQAESDQMWQAYNEPNVINVYSVQALNSFSGSSLCGYAYYPGGPETIVLKNSCTTNPSTFAHEMGHFFGLRHTHGNGNSQELVDGSNCEITGDFICDTPADPKLSGLNVYTTCNYHGDEVDANGDLYNPSTINMMSYSRKYCRTEFTPQQYDKIKFTLDNYRTNLTCSVLSTNSLGINSVKIYPVPTGESLIIETNLLGYKVKLIDIQGRTVVDIIEPISEYKYRLNIEEINNGMYFLKIKRGTDILIHKIIKK